MTIKDMATAAGCNEKTVRRIVNEKMPGKIQNGKVTRFTWDEAHQVMKWLPVKNAVLGITDLGQPRTNSPEVVLGNPADNVTAFAKIAEAMAAIATVVQNMGQRVQVIEDRIDQRQALLPAPQIDPKTAVNKIVREHVARAGGDYRGAWGELYREFGYRTHTDPTRAAKNRGMTIIDYIESEGQTETLLAVAIDLWGVAS